METVVIYCHGYNSSAATDKVDRLNSAGIETYAWNIDVDPRISMHQLCDKIDELLEAEVQRDINLIFLGTSLGAWYASELADVYGVRSILINPCYCPAKLLPLVGCSIEIADLYHDITFDSRDTVFVANDDEVIDFNVSGLFNGAAFVNYVPSGGHRVNGKEFDLIVDYIKQIR